MEGKKLFMVKRTDRQGTSEIRERFKREHLSYVGKDGRAVFGGPLLDESLRIISGFVIVRGTDLEDVRLWVNDDPYTKAGVFESVEIREWKMGFSPTKEMASIVYTILCLDKNSMRETRARIRPEHLSWWEESGRNGFIGPFPAEDGNGAVGTLIITDGHNLEEVTRWAETDPYNKGGIFESVTIYPTRKDLPISTSKAAPRM
eukprot:CAMPEP_0113957432 /NCGR_PEP_ID=MMETSP0011_2-20120614/2776_1 /TAXON_ID=101924 /ORGANISM="Rhodosorus marinus" /LENGTH=202 /DNA_ID=CAMNT_0000968013 /DNA_START=101 /DNA_END=709 /DNA_ORIENTATION=- /assembly_acc=CAM_ASM_000156